MPLSRLLQRVAVVGGGKMGEAVMAGWLSSASPALAELSPDRFVVANPGEPRRAYLSERYGVACVESAELIEGASLVILAVKPQVMPHVLRSMSACPAYQGGGNGPLFVSVAAGLSTQSLEALLPAGSRVVRTMPNMPLQVGEGATAVTGGSHAAPSDVEAVVQLFSALGYACVVDERHMDAVCALSGSGPAYVAALVEALRDAGVRQGLDAALAEALALQTVYGTAKVILETGQTPEYLRKSVCSPGGTTLAALDAMNECGFARVFDAGVDAAVRRSKELNAC